MADMPKTQVTAAATVVKTNTSALIPNRLSRMGKSGAKMGVGINAGTFEGEPKALVFAKGPVHIIERGTKPHMIVPGGARGLGASRRGRARRASELLDAGPSLRNLRIGFGSGAVLKAPGLGQQGRGFAAYVKHPGMAGKRPWAKGVAMSIPEIDRIFAKPAEAVLRTIF